MQDNNPKILQDALKLKNIETKISTYLLLTLSNMLALDFDLRKNNTNISDYALFCSINLSNYLENRSFFTQDFNDALLLFTVAIKLNDHTTNQNLETTQQLSTTQNKIALNNLNICNLSEDEKKLISSILFQLESIDPNARLQNLTNSSAQNTKPTLTEQTTKQTVTKQLLNLVQIQQKYGRIKNSKLLTK